MASGRNRDNIDTRTIRFPPRTAMWGGNDKVILQPAA